MRTRLAPAFVVLLAGFSVYACGSGADSSPPVGPNPDAGTGGVGGSAGMAGSAGMTDGGGDADAGGVLCPPDEDGDNIPDQVEGKSSMRDSDNDGTPDYLDTDSDDDTIPDLIEANTAAFGCQLPADSDNDNTPNHLDDDSDNNGIGDRDEIYPDGAAYDANRPPSDVDGTEGPDFVDSDNDGDQLLDTDELVNGKAVDTDKNGAPDMSDPDSDGDSIGDLFETAADYDNDGKPNFRDIDADGDSIPDGCEAGFAHMVSAPPADSDADGRYDFLDVDSDNDGLKDGLEDTNFDCTVNVGETDRTKADSDGDKASDVIELALGSDPQNSNETPQSIGKYYFVMPYQQTPVPPEQDVVLKTNLNKGDIALIVDSTGTMGGAISNIKQNLNTIVTQIKAEVPDARFGVLGHEDVPITPFGSVGNLPARLPTPGGYLSTNSVDTLAAVQALTTRDGADTPEAQIIAMQLALTNQVVTWPAGGTTAGQFSPGQGYGALGFQSDALPILIAITDAPFHNGKYVGQTTFHDTYTPTIPQALPNVDTLVTAMNNRGAKFIGVALDNGGPARINKDPYRDMAYIAEATNSTVYPNEVWQGTTQCKTDIAGYLPPDSTGGKCRLIFSSYANGTAVSNTVVDGIKALLKGIKVEVRVLAVSVPDPVTPLVCNNGGGAKLIDSVDDWIDYIEVNASGASSTGALIQDPAAPGEYCETFKDYWTDPNSELRDWYSGPRGVIGAPAPNDFPDLHPETVTNVTPGIRVCFKVVPKSNVLCPQKAGIQVVRASLVVRARNEGQSVEQVVGQPRDVYFVVPPNPQ